MKMQIICGSVFQLRKENLLLQNLPITQNEAWRFFSQPLNLPEITPAWLGLRLNTGVPKRMFVGSVESIQLNQLTFGFVRKRKYRSMRRCWS
jgi:hypothetical protein